jgi:transcriptional regulator
MYEVRHFAEDRSSTLCAYLEDHPFAVLVVNMAEGPSVDHIPLEYDASSGTKGRLLGHIARSNPLWREFESGPALAVFSGHQSYISPDWYTSKASDPRVVPTWNYAAVHVSGTLGFFHDEDRIYDLLSRLTDRFEASRPTPWKMTDAPADHVAKLVGAVVGVELTIDRMIGKWKLSQNRPAEDRQGVVEGLRSEGGAGGASLAKLMEAWENPE